MEHFSNITVQNGSVTQVKKLLYVYGNPRSFNYSLSNNDIKMGKLGKAHGWQPFKSHMKTYSNFAF